MDQVEVEEQARCLHNPVAQEIHLVQLRLKVLLVVQVSMSMEEHDQVVVVELLRQVKMEQAEHIPFLVHLNLD